MLKFTRFCFVDAFFSFFLYKLAEKYTLKQDQTGGSSYFISITFKHSYVNSTLTFRLHLVSWVGGATESTQGARSPVGKHLGSKGTCRRPHAAASTLHWFDSCERHVSVGGLRCSFQTGVYILLLFFDKQVNHCFWKPSLQFTSPDIFILFLCKDFFFWMMLEVQSSHPLFFWEAQADCLIHCVFDLMVDLHIWFGCISFMQIKCSS